MDKYTEALNNISNYEIWHTATYDDDGYCNDDDWTEYPFSESEDIKLLSELITKYDTLNKGIDELIEKYENEMVIYTNEINNWTDERKNSDDNNYKEYCMCIVERNKEAKTTTRDFIQDLKKLKGE